MDNQELAQTYHYILITRYVTAAFLVVLIYDHILSFGSEVKLIWPVKTSAPKILFLVMRYTVPIAVAIFHIRNNVATHNKFTVVDGFVSECRSLSCLVSYRWRSCISWMSLGSFIAVGTIATSNLLILLRLWVIWDRNRKLVMWTLLLFLLAQIGGIASTSVLVSQLKRKLVWSPMFHLCVFQDAPPPIYIVWLPGTFFEILLCAIAWGHSLKQPRTSNDSLTEAVYRDGFMYFLLLLCLRIINTIIALCAPHALIFVAMLPVWCATTTTTCRLMIKLRQIDHNHDRGRPNDISDESLEVMHDDEYDELVRSGVRVEVLRSVGPSTPVRSSGSHGSHGHGYP